MTTISTTMPAPAAEPAAATAPGLPDAAARSVDARIRRWLDTHAPIVLTGIMGLAAVPSSVRAGCLAREHWWTAAFLAGEASARPVRPVLQWSAPLFVDTRPVGAVSLRLAARDGAILVSHLDHDAALGAALEGRARSARYVTDVINGAFLLEGGWARPVGERGGPVLPLGRLQAALVEQQRRLRRAVRDLDGAAAGCPEPIDPAAWV